jgi:hypothetical protein
MLGAGLIKLRGDPCWTDLTCLDFHFETQPNPNPMSWVLHHAPRPMLRAGVAFNHFVELVAPFFAFGPRRARHFAGVMFVAFQGFLIVSGNLSFLNWLTIVPALACFDDGLFARLLPRRIRERYARDPEASPTRAVRVVTWIYAAMVAWLSFPVVSNLLGVRGQSMKRGPSSSSKVPSTRARDRTRPGCRTRSSASPATRIGRRASFRRITFASTGSSGSRRWRPNAPTVSPARTG